MLPSYDADNVARNRLNEKIRARYEGRLFDLAAVESRRNEAQKATFRFEGKDYDLLYRPFTDDGGHLNSIGRQVVAIDLLVTLAGIAGSQE